MTTFQLILLAGLFCVNCLIWATVILVCAIQERREEYRVRDKTKN
jgi:ribosomal protein S26